MTALALVLWAAASPAGATQQMADLAGTLRAAEIRVVLYPTYAVVLSRYAIERSDRPLLFEAPRGRGQFVMIEEAVGPGLSPELEHRAELRRLVAQPAGGGVAEFRVRYTVEGGLSRIPIFVPNAATPPGRVAIDITVIGDTERIDTRAAFPRLSRQVDGSLIATVSNLPSVVVLPHRRPFSVVRASEWIVVALVVIASVYWALRTVRLRRRASRPGSPADR